MDQQLSAEQDIKTEKMRKQQKEYCVKENCVKESITAPSQKEYEVYIIL